MAQKCGIWQIKPMTFQDQMQVAVESNNSGFGNYSLIKLTNFKSHLWTHDTCHMDSEGTI